ncbi:MAG: outer membrane beta-barrel protein [Ginsengibacter sp.]
MKKSVLTLAAVAAFSLASKAQTFGFNKGDVILEGAIGVSSSDNKANETKATTISLTPKAGYFVTDKFAVGLNVNYSASKNTDYSGSSDSYTKSNGVGAGVFGRYYFWNPGQRFKVYGEADLDYTSTGNENSNGTTTIKSDKVNTFGLNAGIGANYFLTQKIAIGYKFANVIGYSTSKVDTKDSKATNNFHLGLNNFNNFFSAGQFSLTFVL